MVLYGLCSNLGSIEGFRTNYGIGVLNGSTDNSTMESLAEIISYALCGTCVESQIKCFILVSSYQV